MTTAIQEAQMVQIVNGMYRGNPVNGFYPYLGQRVSSSRGQLVQVIYNDRPTWIIVEHGEFFIVKEGSAITIEGEGGIINTLGPIKLTEEQVVKLIEERFEVMEMLIHNMITSRVNSLIITGAAGIGKTYNVEEILDYYERKQGQHYMTLGGKCTPFGLYEALWACRNVGSILVLDDVEVWDEEDSLNILKKALDTTRTRQIDWRSAGKNLEDKGIPDSFEFKGKVIFLTNVDAYKELARGTKRAPHLNALISRSVLIDLAVHDPRTILLHVRSVIRKTNMLVERGITYEQQEEVIKWLTANVKELNVLSLRTPLMVTEFILSEPDRWEMMCRHTLLKGNPFIW